MKISIVTASYNAEAYIEPCIKSVRDQSYPDMEHIIVDGCSTDGTIDILKKYPHLSWISEPDRGQSDALNKGFKMASGDIIGWLNADDIYLPGALEEIADAFEKHPEADVIYGNWFFINAEGGIIKRFQSIPHHHQSLVYYGPYIGSTALFFRKGLVDEDILLDIKFRYTMDWEWYARLGSLKKKLVYINRNLAGFRIHGENQSLKFRHMSDMDRRFLRAHQLAEGYAIKRCYGMAVARGDNGSLLEEVVYRSLWWFYRGVVLARKAYYILKKEPTALKSYIQKRKVEVNL